MLQGRTNHSRYHLDYSSLTAYCHSRAPSSPKPVTGRPYSTTQICILRRVNSGVRLLSFFRTGSHQPPVLCSFRKKLTSVIVFVLLCCEIAVSIAYHRSKVKQNFEKSKNMHQSRFAPSFNPCPAPSHRARRDPRAWNWSGIFCAYRALRGMHRACPDG